MDRKLARKNIITGLVVGGVAIVMFGLTFLAASLYLELMADRDHSAERRERADPPPRPEPVPMFTAAGITLALVGLILHAGRFVVAGGVIALSRSCAGSATSARTSRALPAERR